MDIKVNEVYTFKLNSGEELVAKVIDINYSEEFISIEEPVSIAPGPQGMGLVPSMFTAEPKGTTKLNKKSIALYADTDENVKTKYIQATTGISVPNKKLILG